jgi:ABC-type nitrate/sulfonate/bicarbonate transport system substrate-binding protein
VGTTFAPSALGRLGLTDRLFFADGLRFPTVGIAVDTDLIDAEDREVRAVIAAQAEALDMICGQAPVAIDAIAALLPGGAREDAELFLRDYVSPLYGPTRADVEAVASDAIAWLSQELTADPRTAENFFGEVI